MKYRQRAAFSLVELLVVIAIIAIIGTFAVPAVQGVLKGTALSTASSTLVDQLSLARQHAISKNRSVEVRFYRFVDPETPGDDVAEKDQPAGKFRALQYFEIGDAGRILPVGKFQRLPDSTMMNPGEELSTLLGEEPAKIVTSTDLDRTLDPELPRGVGFKYDYRAFHFLPDGTTDLPPLGTTGKGSSGGRWFITIHAVNDQLRTKGNTLPPPNFFTWMIDPVSGTSKTFRPGLK